MKELFFLVEEALEGGYTAKAIGDSIFTEAETINELKRKYGKLLNVILTHKINLKS